MKRIFCLLITMLFMFNIISVNASQTETIDGMREYLIECSFPEIMIEQLSNNDIEKIYNNVVENNYIPEIITVSAKFDSVDVNNQTYGMIDEDNFYLQLIPIPLYSGENLTEVMVYAIWQWEGANPLSRQEDAVKIFWDPNCFSFNSTTFEKTDFRYTHTGEYIEHDTVFHPAETAIGALAFYSNVYAGFGRDRGGTCLFYLNPAKPMYKGNNYSTSIAITYYHDKSLVPLINSISFSSSGGTVDVSYVSAFTDTLGYSDYIEYN